ncbi:MAG: hypothetical protein H6868_06250 [Rhodospirillales bacterium]|nr:hypothetical protein [Rhodospirillales bacterium]
MEKTPVDAVLAWQNRRSSSRAKWGAMGLLVLAFAGATTGGDGKTMKMESRMSAAGNCTAPLAVNLQEPRNRF